MLSSNEWYYLRFSNSFNSNFESTRWSLYEYNSELELQLQPNPPELQALCNSFLITRNLISHPQLRIPPQICFVNTIPLTFPSTAGFKTICVTTKRKRATLDSIRWYCERINSKIGQPSQLWRLHRWGFSRVDSFRLFRKLNREMGGWWWWWLPEHSVLDTE